LYAAFDKARASKAGVTALMGAARGGHRQVVEVLLAAGADQGAPGTGAEEIDPQEGDSEIVCWTSWKHGKSPFSWVNQLFL